MRRLLIGIMFAVPLACTSAPVDAPTARIVTLPDGGRVEVLEWGGEGTPIVLLHGSGSTANEWRDFAPLLAAGHRVVALSRRGGGQSSAFPEGGSLSVLTQDIAAVLDTLQLGPVVLVGHSFAGRELTAFGRSHPEHLRGLVYLDAAYTAHGASVDSTLSQIIPLLLADAPPPPSPSAIDELGSYYAQWYGCTYSREALTRITEGESTLDSASQARLRGVTEPSSYGGYSGPVLAIRARMALPGSPRAFLRDTSTTPHVVHFQAVLDTVWMSFREQVPQAQYTEIPDASHCVHASQPQRAATAILQFVAETSPPK